MKQPSYLKILEHPDRDEILSKLTIGISPKDINEWLAGKYSAVSEKKFVISQANLNSFKNTYLDYHNKIVQQDLAKARSTLTQSKDDIQLSMQDLPAYNQTIMKAAVTELDIRETIKRMCIAIETRFGQIFDEIQADPRNINTKIDRVFIEYANSLGTILEKYYKFTEAPTETTIVNNNLTLQVVDQHISVFHEVMRKVLSQMDLQTSLYFMEVFTEEMAKLKAPVEKELTPAETRLAEAKILNETITKKLE